MSDGSLGTYTGTSEAHRSISASIFDSLSSLYPALQSTMNNRKFRSTQGTTLGYDSTQSTLETHRAKIASLESTIETLRTEHRAQITKLEDELAAITAQSDATAAAEASRVDALEARRIEAGVAISAQFAAIIARLEYSELQHQISKDRDALAE